MSKPKRTPPRPPVDSDDDEYVMAGRLLGSDWVFPDDSIHRISEIRRKTGKVNGEMMSFPAVVTDDGDQYRVKSFVRRIDPQDSGDLEPANGIAICIASSLEADSQERVDVWR